MLCFGSETCEGFYENLRRVFEAHGFEFEEKSDNPALLARVLMSVDDVFDRSSGARGAYAARLLLDVVGVGRSERFRITESGQASKRILENRELLDKV